MGIGVRDIPVILKGEHLFEPVIFLQFSITLPLCDVSVIPSKLFSVNLRRSCILMEKMQLSRLIFYDFPEISMKEGTPLSMWFSVNFAVGICDFPTYPNDEFSSYIIFQYTSFDSEILNEISFYFFANHSTGMLFIFLKFPV